MSHARGCDTGDLETRRASTSGIRPFKPRESSVSGRQTLIISTQKPKGDHGDADAHTGHKDAHPRSRGWI